jgi:tRNA dimethylallyltransferase
MNLSKIIFIVGPTGVGKSGVALELAEALNAEIIACDAMQVYQEVAIASDKPSDDDLKRVGHHMINCVSVTEEFDVARYRKEAVSAVEEVIKKDKVPLVVGGSGMYVSILLDGIFEGNNEDPFLRRQLQEDAKIQGVEKLYQRLKKVDPESARKINSNDERRIIRALEVYVANRKPISELQKNRSGLWGKYDIKIFALNRERQELYDRVNARVDLMFSRGLIEEIGKINKLPLSRTAQGLIGIPEVTSHLNGQKSLEETKELMKMNSRHYVKRQLTWFRKDKRLSWITVGPDESAGQVANRILDMLKGDGR